MVVENVIFFQSILNSRNSLNLDTTTCLTDTVPMKITVGVMVHNEGRNITQFLNSLFSQKLQHVILDEIIVISSGSIDDTNDKLKQYESLHPNLKVVIKKKRLGKAHAVNLFLKKARNNIVVLSSADLILKKQTIEHLTRPLTRHTVGMVGAHPVPVNDPKTFFGFAAHLMWELHHQIASEKPKMGELIAFRKIFKQIPQTTSVDEANIEPLIKGQGYELTYAPQAIVFNKGPENLTEFLSRRRHIAAGHASVQYDHHYAVSTLNMFRILRALWRTLKPEWRYIMWVPAIAFLEFYARILGFFDYALKLQSHTVWNMTPSSKDLSSQLKTP